MFHMFSEVSGPTSESAITASSQSLGHGKFHACAFIWLFKSYFRKPSFCTAKSCLVTIMGLNGSWPHRRAFACWQPLPALQRSEVTDFSGKVHFSSAPKQVEARTALFTQTAHGKCEGLNHLILSAVDCWDFLVNDSFQNLTSSLKKLFHLWSYFIGALRGRHTLETWSSNENLQKAECGAPLTEI